MRVLFTAVDAWGHANPMVPLARAFVARGDEVMWASGAASCERLAPSVIGPQPDNVDVARYVPQDQLLPHCAAVVSHGGSGTFLASLIAGLPQLCLPQGADQFLNAEACVTSGTGLALEPREASVESIRGAVKRLLTVDAFQQAAPRINADTSAMPSPADVAEILAR